MACKKKTIKHAINKDEGWAFEECVLLNCTWLVNYQRCFIPIKEILKQEKCKEQIQFEKQKALYLDQVEIEKAKKDKRNQRGTTDIVMGVSRKKKNGSPLNAIRLVECKFDINNTNRKIIEDLSDKNYKTRHFYDFGSTIQEGFVVLLNKSFYQQGKRFIMDGFSNKSSYEVLTVDDFYEKYFN